MTKSTKVVDKKVIFLKKFLLIYFILLVLFFSLFFVVHAIAKTLITIPQRAEVDKKMVALDDIALIKGDDPEIIEKIRNIELVHSPSPGEEKTLDKNYIILRLKKEGVNPSDFEIASEDKIILHRASKTLTRERLEEIVRGKIREYLGMDQGRMIIQDLKGLEDIKVPIGKTAFKLEIRRKMSRYGRLVGYLDVIVDGELYKKVWIQAKASFYVHAAVTARDIKKGESISSRDVEIEKILVDDISKDYITNVDDISGLVAVRNLRKGKILHQDLFSKPILINRGDEVMIVYETDSMKITATGVALERGGLGDIIKVKNEPSQKTIQGRITAKGKVVIK